MRFTSIALVSAALAGCASAPPPVRPPPQPRAPVVERPATWVASLVPRAAGFPFRAGDEQDGSVDVFGGGLRITVRGDSAEWSHDATLAPIVAHARDGDHWLFASGDGGLFRSATFTGRLEPVADAPRTFFHCERSVDEGCAGFDSTGMLAVRGVNDRLFLGNDERFVAARGDFDRALVDVGFVDRQFGVAILAPGQLLRTRDGAEHGEPLDLGGDVPFVVYPHGDSFVVATTRGLLRIDRDGPPVAFTGTPDVFEHRIPEAASHALLASINRQDPFLWPMLVARGAVILADGRAATLEAEQLHIHSHGEDDEVVDLPGESCALHPFGGQVVATCENDRHQQVVELLRRGTWDLLKALPEVGPTVVSPEGTSIVALGPCDEDQDATRDVTAVCVYDGASWRASELPAQSRLVALYADRLLYRNLETDRFVVARLSALDAPEIVRAGTAGDVTIDDVTFDASGSLVVLAHRGSNPTFFHGDSVSALRERSLPPHTRRVGFVDATRGIAYGSELANTAITTDGGEHWTRLELPVEGDTSNVEIAEPDDEESRAIPVCSLNYCAVGGMLIWSTPALAPRESQRIVAATHAARTSPNDERARDPSALGFTNTRFQCDRDPPLDGHATDVPAGRLHGSDGWVEPHATATTDAGAGRYAFTWGGVDDRGTFTAHARAVSLPAVDTNAAASTGIAVGTSDVALLLPRLVTRSLALVERCVGPYFAGQCDLVAVPANGIPRVVGTIRALLGADNTVSHVRSTLALAGGGAAVMISTAFPTFASEDNLMARLDAVVRLGANGVVVQRRTFVWSRARTVRMLASDGRDVGLVVATAPAMRAFVWYGLDPSHDGAPAATLSSSLAPCANPAARDTITAVSAEPEYAPTLDVASGRAMLMPPFNARALLDFSAGSTCLRGVSTWSLNPTDDRYMYDYFGGTPRWRAVAGRLVGNVVGHGARTVRVHCDVP